MQFVRQMGAGVIYALVSIVLVVGGLSLALAESYTITQLSPTPTLPATSGISSPTPPGIAVTNTVVTPPSETAIPPNGCPPPSGWTPIIVQPSDTLSSLASQYQVTPAQLAQANCLFISGLVPGYNIYVPPLPTHVAVPCGPLPGWIEGYIVQPGDTLFRIALQYGTTVVNLQSANCKSGSVIFAGEHLWVPNVPTITPALTIIPTFTTPTISLTPVPDTATPEPTFTSQAQNGTSTSSTTPYPYGASPTPTASITAFPTDP